MNNYKNKDIVKQNDYNHSIQKPTFTHERDLLNKMCEVYVVSEDYQDKQDR